MSTQGDEEKEQPVTIQQNLQYMIEVKYTTAGNTGLMEMRDYYATQAMLGGFLCHESAWHDEQADKTNVTLRFFVDRGTYEHPRARPTA